MGRLDGKVAFVTGAARGQGRSQAVRLAEEGREIIGLDLCSQIDSVAYPMATREDLAETVRMVEEQDHRMVAEQADVRDRSTRRCASEGSEGVRPPRHRARQCRGGAAAATFQNLMPVQLMEAYDVSNAIIWLCSDEARYVTGVTLPVDAGMCNR
jgi:NAD(P)-dependent dehydrogenase (short-subunit alcohol dehydrogenase family)